jgi:hypothetical protein
VDGKELTQKVEVKLDPRVKTPLGELEAAQKLALRLREDISAVSQMVIALRSVRGQIKERAKALAGDAKAAGWLKDAEAVVKKFDELEEKLHNPKAEVTYDILAKKGGARLYSQLAPLYDAVKDTDGPVTQGMREVYADNAKELTRLTAAWRTLTTTEIARLNDEARKLQQPAILVPR